MRAEQKSVLSAPDLRNEERLRLLIETGLILTSERSLEVVVQAALNAGLELCKAYYGVFFYFQVGGDGRHDLRFKVTGADGEEFANLFKSVYEEEDSEFPFPKASIFSNDLSRESDILRNQPIAGAPGMSRLVRSYIAIPVRGRGDDILGAMYYGHPEAGTFDPLSVDLIATVASQAASSIDNIRLSERLSREFAIADAARRLQRQTAERLRQALDAAQLGTWTWNRSTDQLDLDERASRLFYTEPHAWITHAELRSRTVAPEDKERALDTLERSVATGTHYSAEYRVDGPDGAQTWISSSGIPTFSPDSAEVTGMIGTVQDITARKTHDSSLLQSEKLAATGRLAATIAHEINNPLEAVTNLIYLSRTDPGVPVSVRRLLETADSELARVSQIAQQTLGFYRDTTRPVEIDLNQLLHSVVDLFARKMVASKIVCKLDLEPGLCIRGLQGEIRQVFSNLVVNAIDAIAQTCRPGKINIRGRHLRGSRRGVSVLVCDEGSGIPMQVRERVFSPFFTTKPTIGTGLGLWVTRGFIEKQGGSICFRSCTEVRSGTVFRVVLSSGFDFSTPAQLV